MHSISACPIQTDSASPPMRSAGSSPSDAEAAYAYALLYEKGCAVDRRDMAKRCNRRAQALRSAQIEAAETFAAAQAPRFSSQAGSRENLLALWRRARPWVADRGLGDEAVNDIVPMNRNTQDDDVNAAVTYRRAAADCYVGNALYGASGLLDHPDWLIDYKQNAMAIAQNAFENGDWKMVDILRNAYSSNFGISLLSQITGHDDVQAYSRWPSQLMPSVIFHVAPDLGPWAWSSTLAQAQAADFDGRETRGRCMGSGRIPALLQLEPARSGRGAADELPQ